MCDPKNRATKNEKDEPVKSFVETFGEEYDAAELEDEPFTTEFVSLERVDGKQEVN